MSAKRHRTGSYGLQDIPDALKDLTTWACHRRKGGGFTLINPISGYQMWPDKGPIFGIFEVALLRFLRDPDLDGIGVVLTPQDPFGVAKVPTELLPFDEICWKNCRSYIEPFSNHYHLWIKLSGEPPAWGPLKQHGFVPITGNILDVTKDIAEVEFITPSGLQFVPPIDMDEFLDEMFYEPEKEATGEVEETGGSWVRIKR